MSLLAGLGALYAAGFLAVRMDRQVAAWQALVFPLTMAVLLWILLRSEEKFPRPAVVLFGLLMAMVVAAVAVSAPFHDLSWDGMTSRSLQVRWMALGFPDEKIPTLNLGHVLSAFILKTTGSWNAGKAVNLLLMTACFFLVAASLKEAGFRFARSLALLITLNPVALCQISSFQVDGHVACLLMILIVCLAGIIHGARISPPSMAAALLATLGLTLAKNSGIFYAGLILGIFAVVLALRNRSWKPLAMVAGLLGLVTLVFGFALRESMNYEALRPDYIRRAMSARGYGYGYTPNGGASQIEEFGRSSKLKQFLASYFSHTEISPSEINWKPPFWMIRREIRVFEELTPDPRAGGFGPLYGSALLVGWTTLVLTLISGRLRPPWHAWFITVAVLVTSFPSQVWWARWVPQLWILALAPLLLLADPACRLKNSPTIRLGSILTLLVLTLNLGVILLYYGIGMVRQEKILGLQLDLAKKSVQPLALYLPLARQGSESQASFCATEYWFTDLGLQVRKMPESPPKPRMKVHKTNVFFALTTDWRSRLRNPADEKILRDKGLIED